MAVTIKKNAGLGYYKQVVGTGAAPTFTNVAGNKLRLLRQVSEDFNSNFQRDESNEIRNDAQSSGSIITGASAGGTVQLQYSLDTYDDFLAGLLYAADVNDAGTGREDGWLQGGFVALGNILATAASVTFDGTDDSLNGTFTRAPVAGERIYVRGFGNRNLDTVFVVKTGSTTSKILLENDTGDAGGVDSYAGVTGTVVGTAVQIYPVKGYTRNGTYERAFGLVRMYSDTEPAGVAGTTGLATSDWALFRGGIATGIQLSIAPGQAGWTGSIPFLMSDEAPITDATSASNVSGFRITNWDQIEVANNNPLANAIQSVLMVRLREAGAALSVARRFDPLSFNINVSNNASEISATRNRGAIAVSQGRVSASVAMSLVYEDSTYHAAMLADKAYEVEIAVGDADGRAQLWRFPKTRLTSERPNPGVGQPIAQNMTFTAEAGGAPFSYTGFTNGGTTAGKMIEILSFYTRSV